MIGGLKNLYLFNIIIIVVPLKATKPEIKQPMGSTSSVPKRTQWKAIQKAISSSSRRQKPAEPREPVELRMLMVSDV